MLRMSMNELSTHSWTFDQDVLKYSEAGYDAIGVWRSKLSDFGEEKGAELLREQQLHVSNLMWAGAFTGCDGARHQDSIADAIDAIRLAQLLAADCLVIYTGSRFGHTYNHARRMCRNAIRQLIPVAESCGVTLAVEPVARSCGGEWTFLHDLESALAFIDEFQSPFVKLAFDTYHLGQGDIDLQRIEAIGSRAAIVYLGDSQQPPRGEQNRCLLGDGQIPWADIVAALLDGGFRGCCDVKIFGEDSESFTYAQILERSHEALSQLTSVGS